MISGQISVVAIVFNPLIEIICSLLLGTLCGSVMTQIEKLFHSNTNRLAMTIAFIFLTVAVAKTSFTIGPLTIGFSSLLTCMMLGTVFCNICPLSEDIMERADKWSRPLLACFFVLSGAALRMEVFREGMLILIGVIYILSRSFGKYFGAFFSAKAVGCSKKVVDNLGITLLPQAGVALGMCVSAQALGESEGTLIRNIVLFAVLIYELIGPLLTREALKRSGDITEMPQEVKERRQRKLNT